MTVNLKKKTKQFLGSLDIDKGTFNTLEA